MDTSTRITTRLQGKLGELWVFSKLLDAGVNVYLPLVDEEGVDAVVRSKSGNLIDIQVKATRAPDQAGYFNVYFKPGDRLCIVCVDLSPLEAAERSDPEVWIFPSKVFAQAAAPQSSGEYRLPLAATNRQTGKPRKVELSEFYEAWNLLTEVVPNS